MDLAKAPRVTSVTRFAETASKLEPAQIQAAFAAERSSAPRRHARGKRYLVGHSGAPGKGPGSNRLEEQCAVALFNDFGPGSAGIGVPGGGGLRMLDYQLPLKAAQGDADVGKADLLALLPDTRLAVVELKYLPEDRSVSAADTPLRALVEGLAYCAILAENLGDLRSEVRDNLGVDTSPEAPGLVVLANERYWQAYRTCEPAGPWRPAMEHLAGQVARALGLPVSFLSLSDAPWVFRGDLPRFEKQPRCGPAW